MHIFVLILYIYIHMYIRQTQNNILALATVYQELLYIVVCDIGSARSGFDSLSTAGVVQSRVRILRFQEFTMATGTVEATVRQLERKADGSNPDAPWRKAQKAGEDDATPNFVSTFMKRMDDVEAKVDGVEAKVDGMTFKVDEAV